MKITVAISSRDLLQGQEELSHGSRTVGQEFGLAEEEAGIFQTAAQNSSHDGGPVETRMSFHPSDEQIQHSSRDKSIIIEDSGQNQVIDIQSRIVLDEHTIDVVDLKKPLINMQD